MVTPPGGAPPVAPESRSLTIRAEEMALFASATGDVNPLHLSDDHARRSAYGQRVVYGVLGALAALGRSGVVPGRLSSAHLEFRQAMFLDVEYRVEITRRQDDRTTLKVLDGDRVLQVVDLRHDVGPQEAGPEVAVRPAEAGTGSGSDVEASSPSRTEAVVLDSSDLHQGRTARGRWAHEHGSLVRLLTTLGLSGAVPDEQAAVLGAMSYLVGMELPGQRALFWQARVRFPLPGAGGEPSATSPWSYETTVTGFDARVHVVTTDATVVDAAGRVVAEAELQAFVRQPPVVSDVSQLRALAPAGSLLGLRAVVIGGSRGLGAALTQLLALGGADVVLTYARSSEAAGLVRDELGDDGAKVRLVQADAGTSEGCAELGRQVTERLGGIDLLVCNASPAIRALPFTPGSADRIAAFVDESLRLVTGPLAAFALGLGASSGTAVLVSSTAVEDPPTDWPHYVAAKHAAEGLFAWAAARHRKVRFVVVRPAKLLTDQMNTPMGRIGALPVERAAAAIVAHVTRVLDDAEPGGARPVELLRL